MPLLARNGAIVAGAVIRAVGHAWSPLAAIPYQRQDCFQLTGLSVLPDGGLLVLERFYSPEGGSKVRLRRMAAAAVGHPAVAAQLDLLLELGKPLTVDNFEGAAVWTDASGATRVLLISDDNFNPKEQRTLLLDFQLAQ